MKTSTRTLVTTKALSMAAKAGIRLLDPEDQAEIVTMIQKCDDAALLDLTLSEINALSIIKLTQMGKKLDETLKLPVSPRWEIKTPSGVRFVRIDSVDQSQRKK